MTHAPVVTECPEWVSLSELTRVDLQLLESHIETCQTCQNRYAKAIERAETAWLSRVADRGRTSRVDPSDPFPTIPGFEIERRIAHGGQGVVYLARDLALGRSIAIKHLKWERLANERDRVRLLREAAASASLDHPNIVRIHSFGEEAGIPHIVMEYLAGGTLAQRMKAEPFTAPQVAELVEKLALAVQFAHDRRIIHRDLKPSNVLFANNTLEMPKIVDFGIAKQLTPDGTDTTLSGYSLGTPQYVAPEVIRQTCPPGPQADVYSLGAILYVLLTGHLPFEGANDFEAIIRATNSDPVPPRQLSPSVPESLELICLHCLERSPDRRYTTAKALADDLRAILQGEPISLRPPSFWAKTRRQLKRRIAVAAGILSAFVAISMLWTTGSILWTGRPTSSGAEPPGVAELLREESLEKAIALARSLDTDRASSVTALRQRLPELPPDSIGRRNAALFLVRDHPGEAPLLIDAMLAAKQADFVRWLDFLAPHRAVLSDSLWKVLLDTNRPTGDIHARAIATLADWEPDAELWERRANDLDRRFIEGALLETNTEPPLRPRSIRLVVPLLAAMKSPSVSATVRQRIATQVAAGAKADAGFRQEVIVRLSAWAKRVSNVTDARELGSVFARLLIASDAEFVRPFAVNEGDLTIATATLEQLQSIAEIEHIEQIVQSAKVEPDARVRRWLIGAVANIRVNSSRLKPSTVEIIRNLHEIDPDNGAHAAAEYLLLNWNRFDLVQLSRERLRKSQNYESKPLGNAHWFIGPERTTMCVIPNADSKKPPQFAISLHETSKLQYEHFMRSHPEYLPVQVKRTGEPVVYIPVHHVRAYCNWLSLEDKLEPCYTFVESTKQYEPYPDVLYRTGYRLPTEEEWKKACQGPSRSTFPFGRFAEQIELYGNCKLPTQEKPSFRYVCQKLPNPNGLFDMYGNASELCENPATGKLVIYGGSSHDTAEFARNQATAYGTSLETDKLVGFRVAKSMPKQR